jgi:TIR domain-containing protein
MSIFVSHSQQDEAVYTNFCLALEGSHVERWDQETMAVGQSLAAQLKDAIRICDACVFLATKRSVESKWCMAELGAFWGAGKHVIIFLADPEISEAQLPAQFQGNLWTRDARRVLEAIQGLSATVPAEVLTPDLVLLLRYLERDDRWILPDFYGRGLAVANGVAVETEDAALRGWKRAVRYGLLYLAQNGLTQKRSDTSVTYSISKYGKDVLNSPTVRQRFRESFERVLLPLTGRDG